MYTRLYPAQRFSLSQLLWIQSHLYISIHALVVLSQTFVRCTMNSTRQLIQRHIPIPRDLRELANRLTFKLCTTPILAVPQSLWYSVFQLQIDVLFQLCSCLLFYATGYTFFMPTRTSVKKKRTPRLYIVIVFKYINKTRITSQHLFFISTGYKLPISIILTSTIECMPLHF